MTELIRPTGLRGFTVAHSFEGWKLAFITCSEAYGPLHTVKRHTQTDEAFVLLRGAATLYEGEDGEPLCEHALHPDCLYVVRRNTWHHLHVSHDALLLVIENSNTTAQNTETKEFSRISKQNGP